MYVAGRVQKVLYDAEGYYVLVFEVADTDGPQDRVVKVCGYLPGLSRVVPRMPLRFEGQWVEHPKYGQQIKVESWEPWAADYEDAHTFLSNAFSYNVLPLGMARDLSRRFGADVYRVITDEPDRVLEMADSSMLYDQLAAFVLAWERLSVTRRLAWTFRACDVSGREIRDVIATFGIEAPDVIARDPYRLMVVPSLSFATVDKVARVVGVDPRDPRRLGGLVVWALRESSLQGHLYLAHEELMPALRNLKFDDRDVLQVDLGEVMQYLVQHQVVVDEPGVGVYLSPLHRYECEAARLLSHLVQADAPLSVDVPAILREYERENQIQLDEIQRSAVDKLLRHNVLVLTGLPGTGKTTLVRCFVDVFLRAGLSLRLFAPTGIAAKRLGGVVDQPAMTVHRGLRYDGFRWGHDTSTPLDADVVVVDEMSMVDQELFYRLLAALKPGTRLILVGDDAQLPSVGPGNVLRELLGCPDVEHVRLMRIFRQDDKGDIVINSHRIHAGNMIPLEYPADSEFQFVPMASQEAAVKLVVEIAAKLKQRDANFQVLSPMYKGAIGVDRLNEALRERLNPAKGQTEGKFGPLHVRVGDRLMVVKNDYNLGVYNGDVGKLVAITRFGLHVRIHAEGNTPEQEVTFPKSGVWNILRLAYAITVHKCQGSEFDTIILPIFKSQGLMLQRNLFYTALTRARKRVWLLGEPVAVGRAVDNDRVQLRNTVFGRRVSAGFSSLNRLDLPGVVPEAV